MTAPYDRLRAAVAAELAEPGAITRDEIQAVLDVHPATAPADDQGAYSDSHYDPAFYA